MKIPYKIVVAASIAFLTACSSSSSVNEISDEFDEVLDVSDDVDDDDADDEFMVLFAPVRITNFNFALEVEGGTPPDYPASGTARFEFEMDTYTASGDGVNTGASFGNYTYRIDDNDPNLAFIDFTDERNVTGVFSTIWTTARDGTFTITSGGVVQQFGTFRVVL